MVTTYTVQIFPSLLDRLSESASRWVFAQEFAHIASKLPFCSIVMKGRPYAKQARDFYVEAPGKNAHEDAADKITLEWGFDRELQAFLTEDGKSAVNRGDS